MKDVDRIANAARDMLLEYAPQLPDADTYKHICNVSAEKFGYIVTEHCKDINGDPFIKVQKLSKITDKNR